MSDDSDSFDPFKFETDGGYSIEKFYVKTTGPDKESGVRHVKISSVMLAAIEELIHSGKFPAYRNSHDVIRDGLYHIMKYRNKTLRDEGVDDTLTIYAQLCMLEEHQQKRSEIDRVLNLYEETLRSDVEREDITDLKTMLENAENSLARLEGPDYNNMLKIVGKYQEHYDRLTKRINP